MRLAIDRAVLLATWRRMAPGCDTILTGHTAIAGWLAAHGWRSASGGPPSWYQVKQMQERVGCPLFWYPRAGGHRRGMAISTHFVLLMWCLEHAPAFDRRGPMWKPSHRTRRKWKHQAQPTSDA